MYPTFASLPTLPFSWPNTSKRSIASPREAMIYTLLVYRFLISSFFFSSTFSYTKQNYAIESFVLET
ncbi:hypothetical protein ACSBR1_039046 [Camellia fascicularis]